MLTDIQVVCRIIFMVLCMCRGGKPGQVSLTWLCRIRGRLLISEDGQGTCLVPSDMEQDMAAYSKWTTRCVSTLPLTRAVRWNSAGRDEIVLSEPEGTVATRADTVSAWRIGVCVGWRPGGMATVAVFYTVTRGTAI